MDDSEALVILRRVYGDEARKVISVDHEKASVKGDGYTSDVNRIWIKGTLKDGSVVTLPVISKMAVEGGKTNALLKELDAFNLEIKMYTEILPAFENLLAEINQEETINWPQCLHFTGNSKLILTDLKNQNYKSTDRLVGLNDREAEVAVTALARFHAVSVVARDRGMVDYSTIGNFFLSRNSNCIKELYTGGVKTFAKVIDTTWGEEWKRVAQFVDKMSDNFSQELFELRRRDQNEFKVLNHGDYWVSNIMFKVNDLSEPSSVRFFDFQMSHYGSPAWDLTCLLFTNADLAPRYASYDALLASYQAEFSRVLSLLSTGAHAPTLEQLHKEMDRLLYLGLFHIAVDLPQILSPAEETLALEDLFREESLEKIMKIYKRDKFTEIAQTHIKLFIEKKVIK